MRSNESSDTHQALVCKLLLASAETVPIESFPEPATTELTATRYLLVYFEGGQFILCGLRRKLFVWFVMKAISI
jgi:hypothetical protein